MSERGPAVLARARHELRTPLGHIIGYSEMLLEEVEDGAARALAEPLRRLHDDARQLLARLNDVLAPPVPGAAPLSLEAVLRPLAAPAGALAAAADGVRRAVPAGADETLQADLDKVAAAASHLVDLLALGDFAAPGGAIAPGAVPGGQGGTDADRDRSGQGVGRAESGMILVVDDNADNRDLLARRLGRQGHQVRAVADGKEALAALRAGSFDVVLLDVLMPGTSGADVLRELKADPELRAIPVLMISALDEMDTVIRCIELGAEDYLAKPFDAVLLRARVGACLEKKRLRDQEAGHLRALAEWNRLLEERVREQVGQMERLGRLKRFFSPPVAELILSGGAEDPLKTHRREVTVVFIDLRGFTAFAETSEPEELMAVLREYHAEVGKIVVEHEGTVERFAGDAIMIFFNDPVPVDNPAERALRMAVAVRDRTRSLSAVWRKRGHDLGVGLGVAQGYATIGAIGFEGRWDYGAIGTVANLAARLCAEAGAGQILASARVADAVEDLFETAPVEPLTLKGFHRSMPAVDVLGLKAPTPRA
jgi:class 3 adenylate cyclase